LLDRRERGGFGATVTGGPSDAGGRLGPASEPVGNVVPYRERGRSAGDAPIGADFTLINGEKRDAALTLEWQRE
jgi:hypothetical protein